MVKKKTPENSPFTIHHSLFFIDTDMYVMKVWCEFVFDKCHRFILEQIVKRKYANAMQRRMSRARNRKVIIIVQKQRARAPVPLAIIVLLHLCRG